MSVKKPGIDLIWLSSQTPPPEWPLGEIAAMAPTPASVARATTDRLASSEAEAWLFWDPALGNPEPERVLAAQEKPGDVWHAGLKLGMGGLPQIMEYVAPTWMFNCDPDSSLEATSWRLSLACCLMPTAVLRQMGGVRAEFQTLAGAGLEMGCRYLRRGVLVRHLPWLAPANISPKSETLSLYDELLFLYYLFPKFWCGWALARALAAGAVPLTATWRHWQKIIKHPPPAAPPLWQPKSVHTTSRPDRPKALAQVSILIPTLKRYPYLRTLLQQLRSQTIPPKEIIIVDQTPLQERDLKIAEDFADLPLRMIYLDQTGQCLSRNAGLCTVTGEYVLFLDDDDEVPPDLIERHLANLMAFRAEVSAGIAHVPGEGETPENFTFIRASDVFPTNNTMIDFKILKKSGLFDLAYNKLPRADGDLGMRIYLSGALMVLNPDIAVLHHHAPAGGLRHHKARVITYASSRKKLMHRHLPNKSEIYLAKRYFTPRQVYESLWLRAFGTLSLKGPWWRRVLKIIISGLLLPDTLWQIHRRTQEAEAMLKIYPDIPKLPQDNT